VARRSARELADGDRWRRAVGDRTRRHPLPSELTARSFALGATSGTWCCGPRGVAAARSPVKRPDVLKSPGLSLKSAHERGRGTGACRLSAAPERSRSKIKSALI